MKTPTLIMLGLAALLGLWLVRAGRRGRKVDDHPVCRRCRFDLSGRPADSDRCPECGASLSDPSAFLAGNRRRRPGWIAAGAALAVGGLVPLAVVGGLAVTSLAPVRYTPTWLLLRDLTTSARYEERPTTAEMFRRLRGGLLSPDVERRLVTLALARQADLALPWDQTWGDLLEWLQGRGRLPATDWQAYLDHGEPATLVVNPQVDRGNPITFHVHGELRGGTFTPGPPQREADCSVGIPGVPWAYITSACRYGSTFEIDGQVDLPPEVWPRFPAGPHQVSIHILYADGGLATNSSLYPPFTLTAAWTLSDDRQAAGRPGRAAAAADDAGRVIRVQVLTGPAGSVDVVVHADRPPVNLACDVVLWSGNRVWTADDPVCVVAGQKSFVGSTHFAGPGFARDQLVTIVLRPNAAAAAQMARTDRFLGRELVFEDVRIVTGR